MDNENFEVDSNGDIWKIKGGKRIWCGNLNIPGMYNLSLSKEWYNVLKESWENDRR